MYLVSGSWWQAGRYVLGCELEYAQGAYGASAGVELTVCIEQVRCYFKLVLHMEIVVCCVSSAQQM